MGQGGDELDLLLVALGEGVQPFVSVLRHTQSFQPGIHAAGGILAAHAFQFGKVYQLFYDGLFGVKSPFLGEVTDAHLGVINGLSIQQYPAAVCRENVHQNADGGGFARAVSAQNAKGLSAFGGEGEIRQHLLFAKGLVNV